MNGYLLRYVLFAFCIAAAFFTGGCLNEGCTDEKALNYNSVANKDDGSCIFCEQTPVEEKVDVPLIDYNSSSLFYQQVVATAHLSKFYTDFSYGECGVDTCKVYIEIENLTNKGLIFYFRIDYANMYKYANIEPFQTAQYSPVSLPSTSSTNYCDYITASSGFIDLNSTIEYF